MNGEEPASNFELPKPSESVEPLGGMVPAMELDLGDPTASEFCEEGVRVSVAEGVHLRGRYMAVEQVGRYVLDHLRKRENYHAAPPEVHVEFVSVLSKSGDPALLEIRTTGSVSGRPVSFVSLATCGQSTGFTFHMTTMVIRAIAQFIERKKASGLSALQRSLQQCSADICLKLDRAAGHAETWVARLYRWVKVLQYPVALASAVSVGWVWHRRHPHEGFTATLFVGALAGLAVVFFCSGLCDLAAPQSFYLETPRGQRELARQRIDSFLAHRAKSALMILVAGLLVWLMATLM